MKQKSSWRKDCFGQIDTMCILTDIRLGGLYPWKGGKSDIWQVMERDKVLQRIMQYCAEAEHCTQDVLHKLAGWGVDEVDAGEIAAMLYREKFVDDARYAKSFVEEKWRLNGWGRIKIRHMLEEKSIDPLLIDEAIATISDESHARVLDALLDERWRQEGRKTDPSTLRKVASFAASRGFEEELIQDWLDEKSGEFKPGKL